MANNTITFRDADGTLQTVSADNPLPVAGIAGGSADVDPARLVPEGGTSGQVLKVGADGPEWGTDANTTYTAMTAAAASTGTDATARTVSAKVLADEITRRLDELPTPESVVAIADPSTATAEDVATAFNALLAALQA